MNKTQLIAALAFKDIRHNKKSSFYITIVIATICLPLIVLLSLRDGYVVLFKEWLEKTTPAKQLGVNAPMTASDLIDNSVIREWSSDLDLKMVIPHISRLAYVPVNAGQKNVSFEFISTIPGDPAPRRLGYEPLSDDQQKQGIILPKEYQDQVEIDDQKRVKVILERGNYRKAVFLPILGYIDTRKKDAFVSLRYMQYYDRWTNGYGVTDDALDVSLPADQSREDALDDLYIDTLEILKITNYNNNDLAFLRDNLELSITANNTENLFGLKVHKTNDQKISRYDKESIESRLSGSYDAVGLPYRQTVQVGDLQLKATSPYDPRSQYNLIKGRWITLSQSRLEILAPHKLNALHPVGSNIVGTLGDTDFQLLVVGTHDLSSDEFLADYRSIHRLIQLAEGQASYDPENEMFEPKVTVSYEDYPVNVAMVHVNNLEDVIPTHDYFIEHGYDVPQSSISEIRHYLEIKSTLTRFVLLITILGGIACAASSFVLMLEIIRRKNSEIGILKVIGISERFINSTFICQSIFYSLVGLTIALITYFLCFKLGASNEVAHSLFNLNIEQGSIFVLRTMTILFLFLGVLLISLVAGRLATNATRDIDPADIIIKN